MQVIGRVLSSNVAAGTYTVFVGMEPASPMSTSQVPWFTQPSASGAVSFLTSSNVAKLYGVLYSIPVPMTTTQVTYNVQTVDNTSNNYDIGLYNSSGALMAHVGTTAGTAFAGSTGWKTLSWASSATIKQGKYYLAITTNCTSSCAQLIGSSTGVGFTFAGAVQQTRVQERDLHLKGEGYDFFVRALKKLGPKATVDDVYAEVAPKVLAWRSAAA